MRLNHRTECTDHLEASRNWIFRNTVGDIEGILQRLGKDHGTRFEFECYDTGHLYTLAHFLDRKLVDPTRYLACPSEEGDGAAKLRGRDKVQGWLLLSQNLVGCLLLAYVLLRGDIADLLLDQRRSYPAGTNRIAGDAGVPVLAEGIETDAQMSLLLQERCDEMQGYLIGRPRRRSIAGRAPRSPDPATRSYPYLLRDLEIKRPNQVWAMDITYIPMARGFVYLAVVLDCATRRVLSWRLSITMEAAFCVETLKDALARNGKPEIFNTDQGSQCTGTAFTGTPPQPSARLIVFNLNAVRN